MIFFNSSNAPNAPNDVLKTTLFFTKNTLKYSNSTITSTRLKINFMICILKA
jgi:hypothetical protein